MVLPNQTNISDILKSAIENVDSIIDVVYNFLSSSSVKEMVDSEKIKVVKQSIRNTIELISIIASTLNDVNTAMFELNAVVNSIKLSSLFSNPKNLISAIKSGKIQDLDYKNSAFDQYVYLLTIANNISELSSKTSKRDIKKSKKKIISFLDAISDIYMYMYKHILIQKAYSKSGKIISIVTESALGILDLVEGSLKKIVDILNKNNLEKKAIRQAVKNIFAIQNEILWGAFLLSFKIKLYGGKRILIGLSEFYLISLSLGQCFKSLTPVIDEIVKIADSGVKFRFAVFLFNTMMRKLIDTFVSLANPATILITLYSLALSNKILIPLLKTIFENLVPVVDLIIELGNNFTKAYLGINALAKVFIGKNSVIGIIRNVSINDLATVALAIPITFALNIIAMQLMPVIELLSISGKNFVNIRLGIRAINRIFNRGLFSKSLVGILSSIDIKTCKDLLSALPAIALLTVAMSGLGAVINTLIVAGKNKIKIRRGIRVISYVINRITLIFEIVSKKINLKEVLEATIKFTAIALSLIPITTAIILLGGASVVALGAIITIAVISVVVTIYINLLKIIGSKMSTVRKGLNTIYYIVTSLVSMGLALVYISQSEIDFIKVLYFIGVSIVLITVFSLISILVSILPKSSYIMLLMVVSSIYLSSIVIKKISELDINKENIFHLALAILVLTGVVVVIALVSILLPIALIGTSLLFLEMTLITLIAVEIIILSKINISDLDKAKENIMKVFSICSDILYYFMFYATGGERKEGESWMLSVFKKIGGPVAFLAEALMSSLFIATTFITITIILLIVVELRILQEVNLDESKIKGTIGNVFNILDYLMNILFTNKETSKSNEDEGIWGSLVTHVFKPFGTILKAIFSMAFLAISIITVSSILFIATALRVLQEINLDSQKITDNVNDILDTVALIHDRLTTEVTDKTSTKKNWFKKVLTNIPLVSTAINLIDAISNMAAVANSMIIVGMITIIANNLTKIQNIKLNKDTIISKVQDILSVNAIISEKLSEDTNKLDKKQVNSFKDFVEVISSYIKTINSIDNTKVDSFVKVVDKANSIDTNKIKSVRDMFEQMARFSESIHGDFDKLADVLSEKLVDILQKLHITLEGLSNNENGVGDTNTWNNFSGEKSTVNKNTNVNTIEDKAKEKQKKQEKDLKDIKDALDEITLVLKGVRDNTDNYYSGGFGGF